MNTETLDLENLKNEDLIQANTDNTTQAKRNNEESAESDINKGETMSINPDNAIINESLKLPFYPLISCIMPTAGRANMVRQSMQFFMQQDYPNTELIIVYNKPTDLPDEWYGMSVADFPSNIKLVQAITKVTGAKRNEACRYAEGQIIAHWDDDDIYNNDRLTIQAIPILNGQADITGLQNFVFFDAATSKSWQPSRIKFSKLYEGNVHGGSLVYNAEIWHRVAKYSNLIVGEDAAFLKKALKNLPNLRLQAVNGGSSFVYVRHNKNAWHIENELFKTTEWTQVGLPKWAWEYAPFYEEMARMQDYVH